MKVWRWVRPDVVYAVHEFQLARHGGLDVLRDQNAVESAWALPEQLARDGNPSPDAAQLAAAYAWGLAWNHGFSNGDMRTAWVVVRVFLADYGMSLQSSPVDAIRAMEAVAGGNMDEAQLTNWFRQRMG